MKVAEEQVAFIRASQGVYRAADVARWADVHRSTVQRIWSGDIHKGIRPAPEPPNIETKPRAVDVADDIRLLRARGLSYQEIADQLGISKTSVFMHCGVFV